MVASAADIDREQIVAGLVELLGSDRVCTDPDQLSEMSVDRFKKYTAVYGIYDGPIPSAIVSPADAAQVSEVLRFAQRHQVNVVASTGRTGTEGGLETIVEDTIVLDGSRMNAILSIDPEDMQATAQCGVCLQTLEDQVRALGLTTGHSPQSKPLAQMGGLVATRSTGQLSTLYGGIEDMVVGLEAVFPDGTITRIKNVPRRAAGPDIRHVVIGNEGALCFITEVTVKLYRHRPENTLYHGFLVDDIDTGIAAIREVVTNGFRPSVCRVYSEEDAAQHFSHFARGHCVVAFVSEGPEGIARATGEEIERVMAGLPHEPVDPTLIRDWFENLNWGMEKIEAERRYMVEHHNLGFTTEISATWSRIADIYYSAMRRIREEFPRSADLTMLGAHSSHSYQNGTNLYFVYDYNIRCEPREEIEQYHIPINAIIVEETLRHGGSMVHHHGIGKYRTSWTEQEQGSAYPILAGLKRAFDPTGIMNLGTIFPLSNQPR